MTFFHSLKLRRKILIMIAVQVISLAVMGAIFLTEKLELDKLTKEAERDVGQIENLAEAVLLVDALNIELDAIAKGDASVVGETLANLEKLEADANRLRDEAEVKTSVTELGEAARELMKHSEALGYSESSGLQASLSSAVTELESRVVEMSPAAIEFGFLKLRSIEQNFQLGKGENHLNRFQALNSELSKAIATSDLGKEQKAGLSDGLKAYENNFAAVVTASSALGDEFERFEAQAGAVSTQLNARLAYYEEHQAHLKDQIDAEWAAFTLEFMVVALSASVVGLVLAMAIGSSIERPIRQISGTMRSLASGDLDVEINGTEFNNEIGDMARTVGVFRENLSKNFDLAQKNDAFLDAAADYQGQLEAISKAQAVIEFTLEGKILTANENFLQTMGYSLEEVVGNHHSMFVARDVSHSQEYRDFWKSLARGEYRTDEYLRYGKGGSQVWIQASYNSILDAEGKPVKVVKYATDITARKDAVQRVSDGLAKLSQGDLSARINGSIDPNFQKVKSSYNGTMERLETLVNDILTASKSMASDTGQISSGASELSSRTASQAAALEETNASMEVMSGKIKSTSVSAEQVDTAAKEAAASADLGKVAVADAITAMERIEKSSDKISEIITVIESIAFQTNLLALNAAVEAARAGDAGKGFAVVASEVRTLAQRSSEAVKDISDLITSATGEVDEGAKLVRRTGDVLSKINDAVSTVVSNVEKITETSADQARGVAEISSTISALDAKTQENAQLSENSAKNALKLAEAADGLIELVSYFSSSVDEEKQDESWDDLAKRRSIAV